MHSNHTRLEANSVTINNQKGKTPSGILFDRFGRKLNSLRVSVTQRCNLQCFYCHKEGEISSYSGMTKREIIRIVEIACELGMKKVKLTGGEPLLRDDLPKIVSEIADYATEISLTTNGVLLEKYAKTLFNAGVKRVNVSLPSLIPERFQEITKKDYVQQVKDGIEAAVKSRLYPVKVNMVMLKGVNVDEIPNAIDFAQKVGAMLQLIEFQPIQPENYAYWKRFHYHPTQIESWLEKKAISVQENPLHKRRRYIIEKNGQTASVEVVRPMHNSIFCQNCTRLRVTSDGKLKPCLLRNDNLVDIVSLIRQDAKSDVLKEAFKKAVQLREPYWKGEEKVVKSYT